MNENFDCPIWDTPASWVPEVPVSLIDSPRAGGKYFFADASVEAAIKKNDEHFKARLTSWLVDQRQIGVECPIITELTLKEIEQRRDLPVHERADRLLRYLGRLEPHVGGGFGSLMGEDYPRFLKMLAWSESKVKTSEMESQRKEIQFFLNYLEEQGELLSDLVYGPN